MKVLRNSIVAPQENRGGKYSIAGMNRYGGLMLQPNHNKSHFFHSFTIIAITLVLLFSFTGCTLISDVLDAVLAENPVAERPVAERSVVKKPVKENTYISIADINHAMIDAMQKGETELTYNIANADDDTLIHIAENMSVFWGMPGTSLINHEFTEVEGIVEGETVNVKNVTSTLILSDNYYIVRYLRDGVAIPAERDKAI
ncbi:MAG: hypothetical protein LBN36_01855, partial [Clostridiales Family XIII bacterium]|nr:hypothetical protein [Clostridiales Family XIII bacterium]